MYFHGFIARDSYRER